MTREELQKDIINCNSKHYIFCLATGTGKSFQCLNKIAHLYPHSRPKILIVIPYLTLIGNKKDKLGWTWEFYKWKVGRYYKNTTFTTYDSLHKYVGEWDCVILDECFRGDTEILTNSGYKRFDTLTEDDLVAQWDNGNIEFVKPIRLIKRKHIGKICKLHLGRNRYAYMTPNHNQVYRTKLKEGYSDWEVKEIKDLNTSYRTRIPVSGVGTGDNTELTTLERILIAIQADGTLQRHPINESVYSIQLTRERKKERILSLLQEYGKYTTINSCRNNTDRYMIKLPKGNAKLLSTHFNINMGYDRANQFINEILKWDGCEILEGNTLYYSSKIKENSDFVAAVAVQAGYKVLQGVEHDDRQPPYSDIHRVYMRKLVDVDTQSMKKEYLDYDDYVYCVEVPSHKIVVRSEGYTFISGNCHHTTPRCQELLKHFKIEHLFALSATLKREHRYFFNTRYKGITEFNVTIHDAIDDGILPEPKIALLPIDLDSSTISTFEFKIPSDDKCLKPPIVVNYADRFKYLRYPGKVYVKCTQKVYSQDLDRTIENATKRGDSKTAKLVGGRRVKWLAQQKTPYIKLLMKSLDEYRTLTFCGSIDNAIAVGYPRIDSKIGDENLIKFNNKEFNHLCCVAKLDEGANLNDCKIGIFQIINTSERMSIQRAGRVYRHQHPILVFPYFRESNEVKAIQKFLNGYNKDFITVVNNRSELIKLIKE